MDLVSIPISITVPVLTIVGNSGKGRFLRPSSTSSISPTWHTLDFAGTGLVLTACLEQSQLLGPWKLTVEMAKDAGSQMVFYVPDDN